MAGRRIRSAIDLALYTDTLARVAGAIALDTLGFVVWNVGTRPPLAVVRDIRRAFKDGRSLLDGIVATLVGFIFVTAASVLLIPAIADPARNLALAELFAFLVALVLEHLVGDDVRAFAGARAR